MTSPGRICSLLSREDHRFYHSYSKDSSSVWEVCPRSPNAHGDSQAHLCIQQEMKVLLEELDFQLYLDVKTVGDQLESVPQLICQVSTMLIEQILQSLLLSLILIFSISPIARFTHTTSPCRWRVCLISMMLTARPL